MNVLNTENVSCNLIFGALEEQRDDKSF